MTVSTTFRVVDLTRDISGVSAENLAQAGAAASVDLDGIRDQLVQIRDAFNPVLADQDDGQAFRLHSIELDLTVGMEGQVWFVAKGRAEASLKLLWSRTDPK